jgi:hypothetical protein
VGQELVELVRAGDEVFRWVGRDGAGELQRRLAVVMDITSNVGLIVDGLTLLVNVCLSLVEVHRAVEHALRALVGLLIIEMLVAHCSALATDHPSCEHAPQRVRPDYSTVYFQMYWPQQYVGCVQAGHSGDVV